MFNFSVSTVFDEKKRRELKTEYKDSKKCERIFSSVTHSAQRNYRVYHTPSATDKYSRAIKEPRPKTPPPTKASPSPSPWSDEFTIKT